MGTFTTSCLIENNIDRSKSITIPKVMVDTVEVNFHGFLLKSLRKLVFNEKRKI